MDHPPRILDMTPDGAFRDAPVGIPWGARLGLAALGISFVTGVIACLALLAYLAVLMVPVVLGVAAVGYVALRLGLLRRGPGGRALTRP